MTILKAGTNRSRSLGHFELINFKASENVAWPTRGLARMSAVGYEGHIWEELFGKLSFRRVTLTILIIIALIVLITTYFALK